jgi:hypothetical protein
VSSDTRGTLSSMKSSIETEQRDSASARVPTVPPGHAIVYTRYGDEKTVVMNPDDFHRLAALDQALTGISAGGIEMSELVEKAHRLEDEPGKPVEDPAAIRALLGL